MFQGNNNPITVIWYSKKRIIKKNGSNGNVVPENRRRIHTGYLIKKKEQNLEQSICDVITQYTHTMIMQDTRLPKQHGNLINQERRVIGRPEDRSNDQFQTEEKQAKTIKLMMMMNGIVGSNPARGTAAKRVPELIMIRNRSDGLLCDR
jgi:hypothetical protein